MFFSASKFGINTLIASGMTTEAANWPLREEIAGPTGPGPDTANLTFFHVDLALLHEQENFFFYVTDNLNYLNHKRRQLVGDIGAGANIRVPIVAPRPRMHLE
jgi:hypothetical protein